jgi:hypothetical protein
MATQFRDETYETVFERSSMVIKDILCSLIHLAHSDDAITERQMTTTMMLTSMTQIFPILECLKELAGRVASEEPDCDLAAELGVEYLSYHFRCEVNEVVESLAYVRAWLITGTMTPRGLVAGLRGIHDTLPF